MNYTPPDLTLDVVLQAHSGDAPVRDVTLCIPPLVIIDSSVSVDGEVSLAITTPDASAVTIDSTVSVTSELSLGVDVSSAYFPPPLTTIITLRPYALGVPPRNVVLCRPQSDSEKDVAIAMSDGIVAVSGDIELGADIPELRYLTIDSTVTVTPELSLDVTEFVVGVSIDAYADITISSEIEGYYDSNVFRGAVHDVSSDLQYSKIQGIDKSGSIEDSALSTHSLESNRETAQSLSVSNQAEFEANVKLTTSEQLLTEQSKLVGTDSKQLYESQKFVDTKSQLKNETAKKVSHSNWYSFEAMLARQTERKLQGEYSYLDAIIRGQGFELSKLVGYQYRNLIDFARLPYNVVGYVPPALWRTVILKEQLSVPTTPLDVVMCQPKHIGQRSAITLDNADGFDITSLVSLIVRGDEDSAYGKGVIFVTNSVSLNRTDDGREIKLLGFNVGIDSNSYTWSFSATVPLSELSKVDTAREPQIGVDFVCNGNLWRFILDGCDDSASFGESSLTIKGKSRAMLLASPYSNQRGFKYDTAMSARQIAEDELNRFGVPSGFTLDWQLAGVNGWNVPANTYSYSNKTPINSLQWIAEAAGGFINAHMSEDIIHVLANYPIPSWEWSDQTPLLTLPMSLITSRSRGRVNKPAYNGVTLYGENEGGIGALVKRTGTSGGYQPPMVTSDLMTDQAAAISRGKAILSDTGDIGNIGISMPLHSDFGVLLPSTLVSVNDGESWVGMVRGTNITGRLNNNRALEVEQVADFERHFDKESV
ncbi:hypothetical protein ACTXGK_10640 [Psychrobacter sp. T6-5]|uniref:hypothetical protein n=1 Tax=Psychrobacter sp. T6-5 TaxID=3457451 RepID=UPI003FCF45FE